MKKKSPQNLHLPPWQITLDSPPGHGHRFPKECLGAMVPCQGDSGKTLEFSSFLVEMEDLFFGAGLEQHAVLGGLMNDLSITLSELF